MSVIVDESALLSIADKMLDICSGKKNKPFDGFFPIVPELFEQDYCIFSDAMPADLTGPVNSKAFRFALDDGNAVERTAQFFSLREISRKELRKKTGAFCAEKVFCFEFGYDDKTIRGYKRNDAYFRIKDGDFSAIDIPGRKYDPRSLKDARQTMSMLLGTQFNLENQPFVYLRPSVAEIGFKMPIDTLDQLKELFATRDIPDGYKRRAALRNWVAKHLRRKPSKPDEFVEVKKHLRGKTDFSWNGISGTIYVNN